MKIVFNNRNYLTWPKALIELFDRQGHEVIMIDNASTYPPLLEWYTKVGFTVVRLKENLGAYALWRCGFIHKLGREPFVYSDSDYDLSMLPLDWPEVLLEGLDRFPHISKAGLSWDELTVPPENPAYIQDDMPEKRTGVWGNILPGEWYNFPCDTSFAVYRGGTGFKIDGVRKFKPYTGVHLPFHIVLEKSKHEGKRSVIMDDEIAYYFENADKGHGKSYTAVRLQGMVTEYRRRQNEGIKGSD